MNATITKKAQAEQDRQESIKFLRKYFPKGSTVHTILRHHRGPDSWSISAIAIVDGTDLYDFSGRVAQVVGSRFDSTHGGVKRRGGGMDMAFDLVHSLATHLYGDGYALKHRAI